MAKYFKGMIKYLKDTFKYLKVIYHAPKYLKGLNEAVSEAWPVSTCAPGISFTPGSDGALRCGGRCELERQLHLLGHPEARPRLTVSRGGLSSVSSPGSLDRQILCFPHT